MPKLSFFRIFLIAIICLSSLLFALPNFFYSTVDRKLNNPTQTSAWPDYLPSNLVKLGLDLRGGVYMLLEVKTDDVIREKIDFLWTDVRSSLVKNRKELGSIRRIDTSGDQLKIEIGNSDHIDFAIREVSQRKLRSAAKDICSGGLGLYPGFIHIDSGPVRRWGI